MGLPQGSFFLDETSGPSAPQQGAVCSCSIYHYVAKLRSRGSSRKKGPSCSTAGGGEALEYIELIHTTVERRGMVPVSRPASS